MASAGAGTTPLPPKVASLGLGERLDALRNFHTGAALLRDHGGPVVRVPIGPRGLTPQFVIVTSPAGAHDVLAGFDGALDKGIQIHEETKHVGLNIFNLPHQAWKPRRRALQPLFTKKHVREFAVHMSTEAQLAAERAIDAGRIELDPFTRRLTLQVLGRSVLGQDLGGRAKAMADDFATLLEYFTDRGTSPVRVPAKLPTPGNRRFARARERFFAVIDDAVDECRRDPDHPAELIRLLLDARDPETGHALTDEDIRGELSAFLIAGHDTTATTLCYSLWALGRDPSLQDRVAAEAATLGQRPLDADDVPSLELTTRVIHESLRLCPPAAAVGRLAVRDVICRRLAGACRHQRHRGHHGAAHRPRAVVRPGAIRPRPVPPRVLPHPRPLAVPPLRCWSPLLHRRPLRDARSNPRPGHHRPSGATRVPRGHSSLWPFPSR